MSPFEVFDASRSKGKWGMGATVTFSKNGDIRVNRVAFEAMGCPQRVVLMWDREDGVFGCQPTGEEDPTGVVLHSSRQLYRVGATRFFAKFGIPRETRRLRARFEDGVLIAKWDEVLS